jgi:carbonic anhydrase/acetyltransferase-like protein (isoleucine patch superfamily)
VTITSKAFSKSRQRGSDEQATVAKNAALCGDVQLHPGCRILARAVLRGEGACVVIGAGSTVQSDTVLHADPGFPLHVERNVTIGHGAILVGCTIREGTQVGMQTVIETGVVVGRNCVITPGAYLKKGRVFPDNSLIVGSPAQVMRTLKPAPAAAAPAAPAAPRPQADAAPPTRRLEAALC